MGCYIILVNGAPVAWRAKSQKCVSLSSSDKIRVKAAREMLYKFMVEKKVVLTKAGRDKIRSEVKERAPKFKLEQKLFQTEYWIGGKLD